MGVERGLEFPGIEVMLKELSFRYLSALLLSGLRLDELTPV